MKRGHDEKVFLDTIEKVFYVEAEFDFKNGFWLSGTLLVRH